MPDLPPESQNKPRQRIGRLKLLMVVAVCAAPIIASYFTYYVIKPSSRTNYGTLLDPRQYPVPQLATTALDGKPQELQSLQGKWIMLTVASAACQEECRERLTQMRQLRLTQGKEKERIERVWLITDEGMLDTVLMREFDGTRMLRATPASLQALRKWLPTEANTRAEQHLYLIDPLGHLMMRYPPQSDPNKIKKDLSKLLKASKVG